MTQLTFKATRRETLALALGASVATVLPAQGSLERSLEEQFRSALENADMPLPGILLEVLRFEESRTGLSTVVRMTWPPGMRQRKFEAEGATLQVALERLKAETLGVFWAAATI